MKKRKEKLIVKVSKQQGGGQQDDTNIAIGNEDELFTLDRHKSLKKLSNFSKY